ncbi:MAG TPA: hypothetical protein VIT45_02055 [Allosphingosinicella sp.]
MADLSESDRQTISAAIDEALAGGGSAPAAAAASPVAAAPIVGDAKEFFCKNWLIAKQILEFLLPFLPKKLKDLVQKLIIAGDLIHGRLCR